MSSAQDKSEKKRKKTAPCAVGVPAAWEMSATGGKKENFARGAPLLNARCFSRARSRRCWRWRHHGSSPASSPPLQHALRGIIYRQPPFLRRARDARPHHWRSARASPPLLRKRRCVLYCLAPRNVAITRRIGARGACARARGMVYAVTPLPI